MKTKITIIITALFSMISTACFSQWIELQVFLVSRSKDHKAWSEWTRPDIHTKILFNTNEVVFDMGSEGKEAYSIVKEIYGENNKLPDGNQLSKYVLKDSDDEVCMCKLVYEPKDNTMIFTLSYQNGLGHEFVEYKFKCVEITAN